MHLHQEHTNRHDNDMVVASPNDCYIFKATDPLSPKVRADLKALFGLKVRSLVRLSSWVAPHLRQDLLIGGISWTGGQIAMATGALSIDPRSSTIAADVTQHLGLGYRQSTIQGGRIRWATPISDVIGAIPTVLYHGTSDTVLQAIRAGGLITSAPSHWPAGSRNVVCLTATPQIALKHAREAVAHRGGQEIVIQCPTPSILGVVDYDVDRQLVQSKRVPSTNGLFLTQEAGLFATPHPIAPSAITVYAPNAITPFSAWPIIP